MWKWTDRRKFDSSVGIYLKQSNLPSLHPDSSQNNTKVKTHTADYDDTPTCCC